MAFPDVSTGYKDAIRAFFKSSENIRWDQHPGTHQTDQTYAWWVLHSADTSKVSAGVGTPVTRESDYLWIKFFRHFYSEKLLDNLELVQSYIRKVAQLTVQATATSIMRVI